MKLKLSTTQVITYGLLLLFFLLPALSHAQPGLTDDVDDTPIDGGLSLLVAAGVGYGAKQLKGRRSKKK